MLEFKGVTKTFNPGTVDAKTALDNLSFKVNKEDFITIIGANGAGKSTLFGAIAGDFTVDSGEIFLDGREVDDQIRNLEISALASQISQLASCRTKLVQIQRRIAKAKSVVMDGRDICTNVLPEAEFKFYMTASIDVRAERRFKELQENGHNVSLDEVKADIEKRDHEDMTRELNPLVKADDAVEISTDGHTVEEMTQLLKSYIVKKK